MKSLLPALALGAALAAPAAQAAGLDALRWKARVLVISSPDARDARVAAQRREATAPGARERDLVVVEAIGRDGEAAALRRRLGLPQDAFRAVLVGKDGGAKIVSAEPLAAEVLFATIDAMPMRREEAGRGG